MWQEVKLPIQLTQLRLHCGSSSKTAKEYFPAEVLIREIRYEPSSWSINGILLAEVKGEASKKKDRPPRVRGHTAVSDLSTDCRVKDMVSPAVPRLLIGSRKNESRCEKTPFVPSTSDMVKGLP